MSDMILHDAILQLLPRDTGGDWDDVLVRAGVKVPNGEVQGAPLVARSSRRRVARGVIAAFAAALAIIAVGSALAYHYLGRSPGFTGGFSAFDRLPAAAPPEVDRVALEHLAAVIDLSPLEAEQRWRLLQQGLRLGPSRRDGQGRLYALVGENGTACMLLAGHGGTCLDAEHLTQTDGVLAQVQPGYPGEAAAVTALVADDVRTARLVVGDHATALPIVNNSVYGDLVDVRACAKVTLAVTYADGSSGAFPLPNPTGDVVTPTAPQAATGSGPVCR
jgi:hypothetical protein